MDHVFRPRWFAAFGACGALALAALAGAGCRGPADAGDAVDLDRDLKFAMQSARAGLWNEAMYRWERALDLRPKDARLRNNLGVAYEHEGRYDDAEKQYKEALALAPEDDHIRKNYEAFQSFRAGTKPKQAGDEPGEDERPAVETSDAQGAHGHGT